MNRRQVLVALLAASLAPPAAASDRSAYRRAWKRWTRKLVVYRDFGTALILRATLLEPEFRGILADERHRLLGEADDGDAAFRQRMAEDGTAFHEVVLGADSGDEADPRFGQDDARWNVQLVVDGAEAALNTIEHVRKPTLVHRALYPQLDTWSELWIARFARQKPNPGEVVLRLGSGFGHGEVRWAVNAHVG